MLLAIFAVEEDDFGEQAMGCGLQSHTRVHRVAIIFSRHDTLDTLLVLPVSRVLIYT